MSIRFRCPSCSAPIKARESSQGKRSKCPKCDNPIEVPVVELRPIAPPPLVIPATEEASVGSSLTCPHCQHQFTSPAKAAGQQFLCPRCQSMFQAGVSAQDVYNIRVGLIYVISGIAILWILYGL